MPLNELLLNRRLFFGACLIFVSSCTIVKNFPKNQPFIFENTVNLKGDIQKEIKADLKQGLLDQIEDSVAVNSNAELPWPKFPWLIPMPVVKKPPVYDSIKVLQSRKNMQNLMVSRGFRGVDIKVDSFLKVKGTQQRISVQYTIQAGRIYRIDSINYLFADSNLLKITQEHQKQSFLKKGQPFDYTFIDQELNRLVTLFKNHGYYKMSREELYAEADTTFRPLIDPNLDAFEYFQKLAELEASRKESAKVDVRIRMHSIRDSTLMKQYKIGEMTIYPDAPSDVNDTMELEKIISYKDYKIITYQNTFHPSLLSKFITLHPGDLFSQENFSQTLNNFNKLGAWQNISIFPRSNDSLQTIDYTLRLTPAKKQFFSVDLEGSSVLNSNQLVLVGSGKVGLALNFRLRNRNIGKRAIQLENSLRTGVEFNNFQKLLTGEVSFSNRLTIPWMMTPFSTSFDQKFKSAKTITTVDFSYIDRFQYFTLKSFNTFWGYEWKPTASSTWQLKPANIELTRIRQDSLFRQAIQQNPLLFYAYNNGLVVGSNVSYINTFSKSSTKHINLFRVFAEESGIIIGGLFPSSTQHGRLFSDLYRFVRLDVDYRHYINNKNNTWVFRGFAGYGHAFNTQSRPGEITLPFFKSYFAGGPNSMRGWQIRKLGIGSNIYFDTLANGTFNDKYADMRLEANMELRFNLFRFFGFWMRGAVFTDIGNIWFRNDLNGNLPGSGFKFANIYKDIAVASGGGVRMDFTYFLLRLDLGFPVKDPRYNSSKTNTKFETTTNNGGWFVKQVWYKPVVQFAIGYPF